MKTIFIILMIKSLFSINFINPEWITYIDKDGSYKVKFPNQPNEQQITPQWGNSGSTLITYNPEINTDDNTVYYLNVTNFSPDKINSDFNNDKQDKFIKLQASVLIMMVGKPLSEESIKLNNYSGTYMVGEVTQGAEDLHHLIYVKAYFVKSRIYQLMVSCPPEKKDNPSIKAFFDSFELLEK